MNPNSEPLESLFAYLREHIQQLVEIRAVASPVRCTQVYPKELPPVHITPRLLRNVYLVVKEAANNALKHAHASELLITATLEHSDGAYTLVFCIADNGQGFDAEAKQGTGNGLNNMRHRIADIGGEYTLHTASGRGTQIRCAVPLQVQHS